MIFVNGVPNFRREIMTPKMRWPHELEKPDSERRRRRSRNTTANVSSNDDEWGFYFKMRAGLLPGDPDWNPSQ